MIEKRWIVCQQNPDLSQKLSEHLSISPISSQLLLNRGIRSLKEAQEFLNPELTKDAHFEPEKIEQLTTLIKTAIEKEHTIYIFGDYDVDGMTSTAMLSLFLESCGAKVHFFLPNRFTDGYGLNMTIVERLQKARAGLLITLDCGVTNITEIQSIKDNYPIPVVVMDHHNIPATLPPCDVMINPKFFLDKHPLNPLCTAGIVFKVIQEMAPAFDKSSEEVFQYIDLAAIGTVADVASLRGTNRWIVKEGLNAINSTPKPYLKALLEAAEFKRSSVSSQDIGFVIGPRLNAAGRLGVPIPAVNFLREQKESTCKIHASKLNVMNNERRGIGEKILKECDALSKEVEKEGNPVWVFAKENWHAGIIGITASRLVERYSHPIIMIAVDGDLGRGSARTSGKINIYDILNQVRDCFETFGGHKEAAGFSIKTSKIPEFKQRLKDAALSTITASEMQPLIELDMVIDPRDISLKLAEEVQHLGPFGPSNPTPRFFTEELKAIDVRPVGDGSHLKVRFADQHENVILDGIGFNFSEKADLFYKPSLNCAFSIEVNEWRGKKECQISLVDIK